MSSYIIGKIGIAGPRGKQGIPGEAGKDITIIKLPFVVNEFTDEDKQVILDCYNNTESHYYYAKYSDTLYPVTISKYKSLGGDVLAVYGYEVYNTFPRAISGTVRVRLENKVAVEVLDTKFNIRADDLISQYSFDTYLKKNLKNKAGTNISINNDGVISASASSKVYYGGRLSEEITQEQRQAIDSYINNQTDGILKVQYFDSGMWYTGIVMQSAVNSVNNNLYITVGNDIYKHIAPGSLNWE